LRILHLNTYDVTGGAALATYKLHRGLCKLGYDSSMLVAHRKSTDPTVSAFAPKRDLPSRLSRRLRHESIKFAFSRYKQTRPAGLEGFTDDRSLYGSQLLRQLPECDIINLHWVAGFLDYSHFFEGVPQHIPIFWRLSDMNAFTGGCHFDVGCGKHESGCGACPQLGSASEEDLSRDIWKRKERVFRAVRHERLHVVALNQWMAESVRRSPLLGRFGVTVIPNGVETDVFAPRDKHFARDVLGIPQDANVLLFAADSVTNRRKGFHVLTEALNTLPDSSNIALVSVGAGNVKLGHGIPHIHVGHVEDRQRLSLVYSAADVYVVPSLQDNQPNTVLESMACGTPVVGFDVGGIPDMVRPGITGLLAPVGDARGLRAAILQIFEHRETRASFGAACRRVVMEEYTMDRQVRQYAELYLKAFQQAVPRSR
jgi:glycosyltransferase involved in cell wall biosynthesis